MNYKMVNINGKTIGVCLASEVDSEIKKLEKALTSAKEDADYYRKKWTAAHNENVALKESQRWRKVSEELPTRDDANKSGKLLGYLGGYGIAHEYHWTDVRDKLYGITHWMPLPKAPED